ncbi:MAG: RNA-binding transcriptional accessory protein [Fusobacterium perfoetens]|uniref:Tex family protein n=1 Tax=Fusobacterium perfoetens TaxID=852 RepID=UPI0023F57BF1|nr:Tex family protein [Fusobacterium perfoetens]MCI6152912.1 RNA-binding transcriptional accessory protein [Fusobacterium perfoetens]MDY3237324.1 Tex family protein [Fusobacterium perfoetens]
MKNIFEIISEELKIGIKQIENTVKLLDEGSTVPFISRYRKEVTGNLDENQIGDILKSVTYIRNLEKRKEEVINLIEEQGKLTDELKKSILEATKLQEVEDLYLPYKKRRKTKADIAIEKGLEPLSQFIYLAKTIESIEKEAKKYITEEVGTSEEAIEGAKLIVAQKISENAQYREYLRNVYLKDSIVTSKNTKKASELDEKKVYGDYYEYSETIKTILSHRVLALNRGEKEEILNVSLKIEDVVRDRIEKYILKKEFKNYEIEEFLLEIIKDSLDRLILPSIEREVRNILTEKSEDEAIGIFKENLKNLLLQPPLKEKNILGLDPGYRTGCKVAVVDKNGFYVTNDVFHLVEGMDSPKQLEISREKLLKYLDKYEIDIVSIGNGTASRETESFVAKTIRENNKQAKYVITNEAGASVYSASKLANEEFPDLDVTVRGAISIARRIQDPLGELVKIDPKSIGVGMYQHDVDQKRLAESLEEVIASVVNSVGINVNTASWALLEHVSGIKKNIAKNIVEYRKENGNFKNRKSLLKVKGLGNKAYEQMAGFLIIEDGENILDNTIIHPESYGIAEEILTVNNISLKEYRENLKDSREKLKSFNFEKFADEKAYGKETVKDIYEALIRDRRDPRDELERPLLKSDILNIENLQPGMELEGTVRNVVKFGAFVDIGLKNDALLHISEISDKFVKDPSEVLSVGQIIKVKVKDIDKERQRVGLTRRTTK